MSLKEELIRLRRKISNEINSNEVSNNEVVDLDKKVERFINWYYLNMVVDNYTKENEHRVVNEMRNFIEKVAVWYELRYPDYEINKIMPCMGQENTNASNIMFNNNKYVRESGVDEVRDWNWKKFYNARSFIKALPSNEKQLFAKPVFPSVVYIEPSKCPAHLHLNKNGYVLEAEDVDLWSDFVIQNEELKGLHIKDVLWLLQHQNILPVDNELEETIDITDKVIYQKEEMLNAIMYRIIERGGGRIGPRRAFLFAKEFKRNIDIPMMYGIDYADPGLQLFIDKYIEAGGSWDLICYENYFLEKGENTKKIPLMYFYHENKQEGNERRKLYQVFGELLKQQLNEEEFEKELVKKLRYERKIEKLKRGKKA